MNIYYNDDYDGVLGTLQGEPRFNGNISATAWKGPDCINHGYTYEYDDLRRLTAANFKGGNATNGWGDTDFYSMTADYDLDGNITHLTRKGVTEYGVINSPLESCEPVIVYPMGSYGTIDDLTYTYNTENNTLYRVSDAIPNIENGNDFSPKNGFATYSYSNGNLIGDTGKGMSINPYNHLEQPYNINIEDGVIQITYDALGNKLQKRVYDDGFIPDNNPDCVGSDLVSQQDYLLDFLYRRYYPETKNPPSTEPKSRAHRFYHQEGSIEWRRVLDENSGMTGEGAWEPTYQYTIKDHLGNGRLYFTTDYNQDGLADILQESHYYPFGMKIDGISKLYDPPGGVIFSNNGYEYPDNQYGDTDFIEYLQYTHDLKRYNGKEFNRELGLNWYDYGARWYDPAIGRWNAVDPLAEIYYPINPFVYVANNPIKHIDVNGEFIGTIVGTVVGGIAGGINAYRNGEDVVAGAVEGAVSGGVTGAVVDITVASGGTSVPILMAAGAGGGALGGAAGDVSGQVVSNVRAGSSVSNAISNVNTENMASKVKSNAFSGAIGGAGGALVGKGLDAAAKSTQAIQGTMSRNITQTSKTLNSMGADTKTIGNAVNKITTGMGQAGKTTIDNINKVTAGSAMATESGIKVMEQRREEDCDSCIK